jgi:predicted RNA-binding protein Jag
MKVKLVTEHTIKDLKSKISVFLQQIRATYDVELRLHVEVNDKVFVEFIKANKKGQALFAIQKLCEWADREKINLGLIVSDDYGSNTEDLVKLYSHFGFVIVPKEMERIFKS